MNPILSLASAALAAVPSTSTVTNEPNPAVERFRRGCAAEITLAALAQGREVDADGYPLDTFAQGQVLLELVPGTRAVAAALHDALGARVLERIDSRDCERIELPPGVGVADAMRVYAAQPFVVAAYRNFKSRLLEVPYDPIYNDPVPGQWDVKRIGLERAWDTTKGASNVRVAIVDSGIAPSHDDLGGALLTGRNVLNDTSNTADNDGHGTNVALIVGANHNQYGTAGVAPECRLLPVKIVESGTDWVYSWDAADGIFWAIEHDADVINLSYGSVIFDPLVANATAAAFAAGCIVVAGAGNDGTDMPYFPAANANVIAVAGTGNQTDKRWSSSNFGSWVDVAAPGVGVVISADETFEAILLAGTSYSAPLVSGIAALVVSVLGKSAPASSIASRILDHCDPVPGNYVAKGRVNALRAVTGVDLAMHASWAAVSLAGGTYTSVGGGLEQLSSTYGNDLSFDTRSVGSSSGGSIGPQTYTQTVAVALNFDADYMGAVDELVLRFEGRASIANLPLSVQVFNWSTFEYVTIGTQPLTSTTADTVVSCAIGNPATFIGSDGRVLVRYRASISNFGTPAQPFTIEMDLARMRLVYP